MNGLAHYCVLVVEDNPSDADLAAEYLSEMPGISVDVRTVTCVRAAEERLASMRADAVILDLQLPDSSGLATLRRIAAVAGGAPLIVVSGLADERTRRAALDAGAEEYFDKNRPNTRLFARSVLYLIERNRAREQRRQSQRLLDTTPDAILVVNRTGLCRYVNQAALDLFGRRRDELLGQELGFPVADTEPVEIVIARERDERTCEMRVVPLEWDGEDAWMASIRDITERRTAEALRARSVELEAQNHQFREATRLKSEFLANMSHEIRTPMNAIIGVSYLFAQTRLDAEQRGYVSRIQAASSSLLALLNDLLDLSKIEAGQMTLEQAPFELAGLLHEIEQMMAPQAEAKTLALLVEAGPNLPRRVIGDVTRVRQILLNLLSNAVKFTEQGSVHLLVESHLEKEGRATLRITVRDTGVGIPLDAQARLFAPFVQADASTTRRFGGTGLGLSIVRRLADMMDGSVELTSAVGLGSEFRLTLPLLIDTAPESDAPAPAACEPMDATMQWLDGVRVLVVDDSDVNLEVAQKILAREGARVSTCQNGLQALERLQVGADEFDVVLMDVQTPLLDGNEATRRLRGELHLTLPVIALTAGALVSERQRALESGMNDFITKPFDPAVLIRTVREHVQRARGATILPRPRLVAAAVETTPLFDLPGFDAVGLERRLGGDQGQLLRLIGRMVREFADLGAGGDFAGAEARHALAARLHKLHGSAGVLGAVDIQRLTAHAESILRANAEAAKIEEAVRPIAAALADLSARLDPLVQERERARTAAAAATENVPPLRADAVRDLITLLERNDLGALEQFNALDAPLRALLGPRYGLVSEAVDRLAFDDAAALLAAEPSDLAAA